VHFFAMATIVLFLIVHIVMVLAVPRACAPCSAVAEERSVRRAKPPIQGVDATLIVKDAGKLLPAHRVGCPAQCRSIARSPWLTGCDIGRAVA